MNQPRTTFFTLLLHVPYDRIKEQKYAATFGLCLGFCVCDRVCEVLVTWMRGSGDIGVVLPSNMEDQETDFDLQNIQVYLAYLM